MITIFTTCRPFVGEFITSQYNAIRSWQLAVPDADIMIIGDDEGSDKAADVLGVRHLGGVDMVHGKPRLAAVWRIAREHAQYDVSMYVNADIVLLDDFWPAVQAVKQQFGDFLVIGRRTDVALNDNIAFAKGWQAKLRDHIARVGKLYTSCGMDFFLFRGDFYRDTIPPKMLIGCVFWDNWLVWRALNADVPVVNATRAITTIHQSHPQEMSGWHEQRRNYNRMSVPQPWGQYLRGNQDATWTLDENLSFQWKQEARK